MITEEYPADLDPCDSVGTRSPDLVEVEVVKRSTKETETQRPKSRVSLRNRLVSPLSLKSQHPLSTLFSPGGTPGQVESPQDVSVNPGLQVYHYFVTKQMRHLYNIFIKYLLTFMALLEFVTTRFQLKIPL